MQSVEMNICCPTLEYNVAYSVKPFVQKSISTVY